MATIIKPESMNLAFKRHAIFFWEQLAYVTGLRASAAGYGQSVFLISYFYVF